MGIRCRFQYELSYGVAVGGLAGVLFALVDTTLVGFLGTGIPWILLPMMIAFYLVLGWAAGALLAGVTGLLAGRGRIANGRAYAHTDIRRTCLVACVALVVGIFYERLRHGYEVGFGEHISSLAILTVIITAAMGIVWVRHRPSGTTHLNRWVIRAAPVRKRSSAGPRTFVPPLPSGSRPGRLQGRGSGEPNPSNHVCRSTWASASELFVWPVIWLAFFLLLWKPVNDRYQAPLLSTTGLLANTGYMTAMAIIYFLGHWIARHTRPLIRVATTAQCWCSTVAASLVAVASASGALWSVREKPIDLPYQTTAAGLAAKASKMPNVVLIVMDTTRADHLSTYGYERDTTPNLTALAREGVLYTRAIAPSSWTLPSHASLFTGLLPSEHDARHHLPDSDDGAMEIRGLAEPYTTLAEVLLDHGYNTAAVIGNTAVVTRQLGFAQGFLYFDDREKFSLASADPRVLSPGLWMTRFFQRHAEHSKSFKNGGWQFRYFWRDAHSVNAAAYEWLDRRVDAPFLLFINYVDAHDPYRPHPEFDDRLNHKFASGGTSHGAASQRRAGGPVSVDPDKDMANYDADLAFVDQQIGALFARLKSDGQYQRSLIIVTADHGEAFGEHGFFGHNNSLYQEEVHVPLIIRYPGGEVRGVNHELTSLASVPSTILAHLGMELSPEQIESEQSRKGLVLAELGTGDSTKKPPSVWSMQALYTPGGTKVITGATPAGSVEIYDLNRDPHETKDLSAQREDRVHWAREWLDTWTAGAQRRRLKTDELLGITEEQRRKLSTLGYLD